MTLYDHIPGEPKLILFPVHPGKAKPALNRSQAIHVYFSGIVDELGRTGQLTGEALREWQENGKEDHDETRP